MKGLAPLYTQLAIIYFSFCLLKNVLKGLIRLFLSINLLFYRRSVLNKHSRRIHAITVSSLKEIKRSFSDLCSCYFINIRLICIEATAKVYVILGRPPYEQMTKADPDKT